MKEETIEILKKHSQEHLLQFLPYLTKEEQENLENQILKIDFEQLDKLYESTKKEQIVEEKKIEHISYTDKSKLTKERKEQLESIGKQVITSGKYAVITMAGGQGSRLGHQGPKGTYSLNTVNGPKYLFEIIIDTFKRAQKEYNVTIPWYVMTSRENHKETVEFLEEHQYFGYDKSKVKFFTQGELPLLDTQGNVILDKDKKIKEAADGNGGIYGAIAKSGFISEMREKGIEWIFISNMDNILSNFIDPLLVGLTIEENRKIAAKSVAKNGPKEKIGVLCKVNGRPRVIEYIDLPEELAEARDEDGELLYGEGNFGNYLVHREVLEDLESVKLPYHAAFKKSNYLDEQGKLVEATQPNAYKFEAFVFDVFARYDEITILRVKREDEFAPVKNATGEDSPETATVLYNAKYGK